METRLKTREELLHELSELVTTRASEKELREAYYSDVHRYYSNSTFSNAELVEVLGDLQ